MCGAGTVSLRELLKESSSSCGSRVLRFEVPLVPHSTVRGAASLDWRTRPGLYLQVRMPCKVPASNKQTSCQHQFHLCFVPASTANCQHAISVHFAACPAHCCRLQAGSAIRGCVRLACCLSDMEAAWAGAAAAKVQKAAQAAAAAATSKGAAKRSTGGAKVSAGGARRTASAAGAARRTASNAGASDTEAAMQAAVAAATAVGAAGYCSAVFITKYDDSDLFHTLEDTVRRYNAVTLGLTSLPTPRTAAAGASGSGGTLADVLAASSDGSAPPPAAAAADRTPKGAASQQQVQQQQQAAPSADGGALVPPLDLSSASAAHPHQHHHKKPPGASCLSHHSSNPASKPSAAAAGGSGAEGSSRPARAHFAEDTPRPRLSEGGSSVATEEEEEPPRPCDLKLDAVLGAYSAVLLEPRLLQVRWCGLSHSVGVVLGDCMRNHVNANYRHRSIGTPNCTVPASPQDAFLAVNQPVVHPFVHMHKVCILSSVNDPRPS